MSKRRYGSACQPVFEQEYRSNPHCDACKAPEKPDGWAACYPCWTRQDRTRERPARCDDCRAVYEWWYTGGNWKPGGLQRGWLCQVCLEARQDLLWRATDMRALSSREGMLACMSTAGPGSYLSLVPPGVREMVAERMSSPGDEREAAFRIKQLKREIAHGLAWTTVMTKT